MSIRLGRTLLAVTLVTAPLTAQTVRSEGSVDFADSSGIPHALAALRATQIRGVRYELTLDLTAPDTARGHAVIRFTTAKSVDVILDFRGPELAQLSVNGQPGPAAWNHKHLRVPASLIRAGDNEVDADFTTLIAPAGASIIRFRDETDGATYLYTLLVPSDANALFPCFDQPDLKARLTLTLKTPRKWSAVANGITERVDSTGEIATYHFRQTDPLPTYLFAFAAGPWVHFTAASRGGSLWVRASRAREVEVDSLQAQVASAIASLERYFDVPYPFQQFQYLLAPAFPFGGMEHPGLTMFNEESFIYREPPTISQRLGRRATIYHEVAHQWFGDDVTMRWFDDLWLKEGFATYMAAKMQEMEGLPNPWMTFYLRNKPLAYDVDQTAGTTPIWQQLGNLDQAKSNYGAIVYNKAPGVLKQLNYLVGDSAFRAGVHDFLVRHAYGNATWQDLLGSIGNAWGHSLSDWGSQYILRPGMPVLEQSVDVDGGHIKRLLLVQHPAEKISGKGVWPIKTEVVLWRANGKTDVLPFALTAESTVVRSAAGLPSPDFVFANYEDDAYALLMLDRRSTDWLLQNVGTVKDSFLRAMLWGALWDEVRDARLAPTRFMATALRELPRETDDQIAGGIVSRLSRATEVYLSTIQRDSVQADVERVLLNDAADPSKSYSVRKSQLDAYINVASTAPGIRRLQAWLDSASTAGQPLRQPTRWSIVTQLVSRGVPGSDALLAGETRRDTSTAGQRRAFIAGAARPSAETKRSYFDRYFQDRTLNEDWVTGSLRSFNEPDQSTLTLPYLVPALDTLGWIQQNRRIFFLGSWLGGFVGGQRSSAALQAIDGFLANHPSLPRDLREKILQVRDDLERTVRIRMRFAGD